MILLEFVLGLRNYYKGKWYFVDAKFYVD